MNPTQISAQYAAYTWFLDQPENATATPAEAQAYARGHWEEYQDCAHEGFGRLLLDIVSVPAKSARRPRKATPNLQTAVA